MCVKIYEYSWGKKEKGNVRNFINFMCIFNLSKTLKINRIRKIKIYKFR